MKFPAYPAYKDSGEEWLGKVPNHWDVKKVKFIATINDDEISDSTDPEYVIEYVDIGSVDQAKGITSTEQFHFEAAPSRARRRVRHGDTIVSTVRTYLKAVAPIVSPPENLIVSTGFAVIRPTFLLPRYLAYHLRSAYFIESIVSRSVGVSYPAINASEIGEIFLPVPGPVEQQRIAEFLDTEIAKLDRLVERKRTLIDRLKEKRSAVISLAVTKGLPSEVVEEYAAKFLGLDPKALVKRTFKPSGVDGLGEVPVGWNILALKRTWASCEYGISESLSGEGPIRVLTMGHIRDGRVLIPEDGCLDCVEAKMLLADRDILFNRTNSMAHVGKVGLYRKAGNEKFTFASYLVRIRTNDRIIPEYLTYLLNTPNVLELARSLALPSINQANLNPTRYGQIMISFPTLSEQKAIIHYLDRETSIIDHMIEKIESAIEKLSEYRSALITAAVTGKIDVRGYKP